jgi:carbonic anhydrase
MNRIIQGIQQFQNEVFPKQRELFERLAAGQSPETLFVSCSDSRVSPEMITQTAPGDLFVCRNAGNIVPSYGQADAVSASIEYAVSQLPIQDIVVCGHSDCGAMKGILHPEALEEMPHVKMWLTNSEEARRAMHSDRRGRRTADPLTILTRLNVQLQLEHLSTHPEVFARVQHGRLRLHGWVYQLGSGAIDAWDSTRMRWTSLNTSAASLSGRVQAGAA